MKKIFIDGHGECEVWVLPKLAPSKQRKHRYDPESFVHPAKGDVVLFRKIIEKYTREGDLVLDPMAGISTTQIEAALLGRNAVGIELEEKFVRISERNIERLEKLKTLAPKGRARIIQGDARELTKVLSGKVDVAVFSPPFADSRNWKARDYDEEFVKVMVQRCKDGLARGHYATPEAKLRSIKKAHEGGKVGKNNISNLLYKPVDAVVFSPPFGEAQCGGGIAQKGYEGKHGKDEHLHLRHDRKFSEDEKNISNLPYGIDAVITSPPFGESNQFRGGTQLKQRMMKGNRPTPYSDDKENIGNLPYGVDAIVTSPPYVPQDDRRIPWGHRHGALEENDKERGFGRTGGFRGSYGDDPTNIGNPRKYGEVDAIVTSPPYSETCNESKNTTSNLRREERLRTQGHNHKDFMGGKARVCQLEDGMRYSHDPKNIGNLHHGQVDSIITSPPYSEGTGHGGGRDDIVKEKHLYLHDKGSYSESEQNIGQTKGETYLQAMLRVYAECFKVLKPDGRMVLVLKNFIRQKRIMRLDLDTKRLCEAVGFRWVETKLFRLPSKSFWRVLYERKHPEVDTSLLRYEFVEVFEKPLEAWA